MPSDAADKLWMSLISLMITQPSPLSQLYRASCCEAIISPVWGRGSCHLPFLCSRYMTILYTRDRNKKRRRLDLEAGEKGFLVLPCPLLPTVFPSATSDVTVSFPFSLLTHPRSPPFPSAPPPPALSRQLYYKKYTVSIECPSDIFDLLASFRTVFNQPP